MFSAPSPIRPAAVNQPNPAIVAQSAVRRLPRWALLGFCLAYVLPGFVGRDPWKNADIAAYGIMVQLARAPNDLAAWLAPALMGQSPEVPALLPYWLGAWAILLAPAGMDPAFAARIPFIFLLIGAMVATWYAIFHLARSPAAQPVAFAFGGEAQPTDYARALADAGLLALIACLGLAQLSHETTPAVVQLTGAALLLYGYAALPRRPLGASASGVAGLLLLTLSGAPSIAALLGCGAVVLAWGERSFAGIDGEDTQPGTTGLALLAGGCALALVLATLLDLWSWQIAPPDTVESVASLARMFLWFGWPAWPLALWTLWRWRRQVRQPFANRHLGAAVWFAAVPVMSALLTQSSDRSLLLSLPAMAALAGFALPTLQRSVSALIDWFTLLFFSSCAAVIWIVWISMMTGFPRQPAGNVAKLAPGFVPTFSLTALVFGIGATVAWLALVRWRVSRQRSALWKSLVLPAGGAALCWLLLMTLWLPLLDHSRSYTRLVQSVVARTGDGVCVHGLGLSRAQRAALVVHSDLTIAPLNEGTSCPWLLLDLDDERSGLLASEIPPGWHREVTLFRLSDRKEGLVLFRQAGSGIR